MKWKNTLFIKLALGCFLLTLPIAAAYNRTGKIPLLLYIIIVLNIGWIVCLILYFVASKDTRVAKKAERKARQAEEIEHRRAKFKCPLCQEEGHFFEERCSKCGYDLGKYKQEIENEPIKEFFVGRFLILSLILGGLPVLTLVQDYCQRNHPLHEPLSGFMWFLIIFLLFFSVGFFCAFLDDRRYEKLKKEDPFAAKLEAYKRRKEDELKHPPEEVVIQREKEAAIFSQRPGAPEWETRYSTHPCPYCGHYKVRHSEWEDIQFSVAFWGVASDKIGKAYKCEKCGKMW